MGVIRYLLRHKAAMALATLLLMALVACDLALPTLTSDIVDVGIQQAGIEHVATDRLSGATHDAIAERLEGDGQAQALFAASYAAEEPAAPVSEGSAAPAPADPTYALTAYGRDHLSELDQAITPVMVAIRFGPDAVQASGDAVLTQQGIAAARAEYERLGYDLTAMQMGYLLRLGALMLDIAAVGMALNIAVSYIASRTGARIGRDLRNQLFARVVGFSEAEIGSFSAASLITRGTNDVQLVQNVSIMLMRMVMYAPIMAVGGIVMVMVTNASMGWVIVAAIVAVLCVIGVVFRLANPKFKVMQKLIDRVNLVARDMMDGLPVIRAFDREAYEEQRFDEASARLMRTQLFTNRIMAFMMPSMMLIMNLTSVAIVYVGGLYIDAGTIQTGDLIAFITYAMVIIMSFLMLGMMAIMLPRANVAAQRVDEVLATRPTIADPPSPRKLPDEALDRGAEIAFHDVSFRYDDSDECVLEHVSFVARPGTTLAIIGPTGAGKSTIVKLMERFYDVTEGSVTVDGVDVRDLAQADLRATFGYAPQAAFLFSGTVRSNVAYSDESMPIERVEEALAIAQARSFVDERPEGLDAPIDQGGANVSGGQRQRLAVARALATQARALLFDDTFSALDYRTDARLRAELERSSSGSTRIVVAQRISTVMHADRIVVLDEGRVAGQGTHGELMASCEAYREIALSQLSAVELAEGGERP